RPLTSTLFPYTTLFRSLVIQCSINEFSQQSSWSSRSLMARLPRRKPAVAAWPHKRLWPSGRGLRSSNLFAPPLPTAIEGRLRKRSEEHTSELQSRSDLV